MMANCNKCGGEIIWLRDETGKRWLPPFDPQFSRVMPEPGETAAGIVGGEWRRIDISVARIYKSHMCTGNPVDMDDVWPVKVDNVMVDRDGVILDERPNIAPPLPPDREVTPALEEKWAREEKSYSKRYDPRVLDVSCEECDVKPGFICRSPKQRWPKDKAHNSRRWKVFEKKPPVVRKHAFEGKGAWPPSYEKSPTDFRAMRQFLRDNPDLFDIGEPCPTLTPEPSPLSPSTPIEQDPAT
jgi:hypothetical protein